MSTSLYATSVEESVFSEIACALGRISVRGQIGWRKRSLKEDLCLDSLDIAGVILHLEKKYAIEFDGENMPVVETATDLVRYTLDLIRQHRRVT